jgi:hypothetical protein
MKENDDLARNDIRDRLWFHAAGYTLTMLLAVPGFYLGVVREDWDRDTRMTLGIGGAGLALGGTLVMLGILFRLWKQKREETDE